MTLAALEVSPAGGEQLAAAELVTGLLASGHRVTVIAARCELPPHPSLRVIRLPVPIRPASITMPLFLLFGSLALRRHRDGVVHTVGALVLNRRDVVSVHFCHRAFRARKQAPRRSRSTFAYRVNEWIAERFGLAAERWAYRPSRAGLLISVSSGGASELRRYFPAMADAVAVIPNGVDLDAFRFDSRARATIRERAGIGPDQLVALFVGGDWGRKGLATAIQAVARSPRWQLLVVGAGDADAYRALAERTGADGRVLFAGVAADAAPYYSASDALLLPTAYETFSLVTYEAAAAGLPLLVTPVSGVEDVLRDGENGWFIERDAADVAGKLDRLGDDEAFRRAMGEAARAAVGHYRWDRVVARYAGVYRTIVARAPRS